METRSNPGSRGHVREEGPPFGWRREGLRPSNRLRPRGERGGAPWGRGRGRGPVHHRVHGWRHYHTAVPWRGGAGAGRPRPGEAGPSRRKPIRGAVRGGGGGATACDPNTRVRVHFGVALLLGLPVRGPGSLLPHWAPPPSWPRTSPLRRGECGDGCREARAAPPSPLPSSPHAPPVFPLSPLITAGWLGEEGRWPRRSLGGRLPLTRELP